MYFLLRWILYFSVIGGVITIIAGIVIIATFQMPVQEYSLSQTIGNCLNLKAQWIEYGKHVTEYEVIDPLGRSLEQICKDMGVDITP